MTITLSPQPLYKNIQEERSESENLKKSDDALMPDNSYWTGKKE